MIFAPAAVFPFIILPMPISPNKGLFRTMPIDEMLLVSTSLLKIRTVFPTGFSSVSNSFPSLTPTATSYGHPD